MRARLKSEFFKATEILKLFVAAVLLAFYYEPSAAALEVFEGFEVKTHLIILQNQGTGLKPPSSLPASS